MRLRVDLAYDGTDFHGWARQPGLRTVEGVLLTALATALRLPEEPDLVVAGRTDAGVHARGQVAHVDVPVASLEAASPRPEDSAVVSLRGRLRGLLPDDVALHGLRRAAPGFDARFSAVWRRYRYRLHDDEACLDPVVRHAVVSRRHRLDESAMARAAAGLLGEHDFLAYCRPRPGASTVRELQELLVTRAGGLVEVEVRADAFCHRMVRALVGALVAVGEGRRDVGWPATVLARREHDPAVTVMPAHGLVLEEVGYPDDAQLATRADRARRRRGEPLSGRR